MSYKVVTEGKTTVIDNISVYGKTILVLESKNYTMIQGTAEKPFWRGKGVKRYFNIPSPLKQNQYHVKLLSQFLLSKNLKLNEFVIEHYIIVPDKCEVDVCDLSRNNLLHKSELDTLKRKLAFYNSSIDDKLSKVIKEALF